MDHAHQLDVDLHRNGRPRVWSVFVVFVVAVIAATTVATLILVVHATASHGSSILRDCNALLEMVFTPSVFILTVLGSHSVIIAVTLLASVGSPEPLMGRLRLHRTHTPTILLVVFVVGCLALGQLLDSLSVFTGLYKENSALAALSEMAGQSSGWTLLQLTLVLGLLPGVGEELLFRGYIQTRLVRRWGRWAAILVTSVLFGLFHMDVLHSLLAFFMGIYLGYIAELVGGIGPVIIVHALNNMVGTVLNAFLFQEQVEMSEEGHLLLAGISLLVLVVCLVCIRWLPARRSVMLDALDEG